MEASFYHDDGVNRNTMKLKRPMTLDFGSGPSAKKPKSNGLLGNTPGLLSSPDLKLLQLASPELERMIIQQNGMVTTPTPTPTQFLCPKSVTEEQEAYARGFVDALEKLRQNEDIASTIQDATSIPNLLPVRIKSESVADQCVVSTATPIYTTLTTASEQLPRSIENAVYNGQVTTMLPITSQNNVPSYASALHLGTSNGHHQTVASMLPPVRSSPQSQVRSQMPPVTIQSNHMATHSQIANIPPMVAGESIHLKEEPQIVPCLGGSPPISPINMEFQEHIKLDRKRERNRVAARKCRTRKLERISRLEERVDDLKDQNTSLSQAANDLRDQVCKLKQKIMEHVNSGCKVMLSQNIL